MTWWAMVVCGMLAVASSGLFALSCFWVSVVTATSKDKTRGLVVDNGAVFYDWVNGSCPPSSMAEHVDAALIGSGYENNPKTCRFWFERFEALVREHMPLLTPDVLINA